MIFVFYADGGIYPYDTPDKACLAYESVSVESEIVEARCVDENSVFDPVDEMRARLLPGQSGKEYS